MPEISRTIETIVKNSHRQERGGSKQQQVGHTKEGGNYRREAGGQRKLRLEKTPPRRLDLTQRSELRSVAQKQQIKFLLPKGHLPFKIKRSSHFFGGGSNIRTPMLIQGRLERTETNIMHFERGSV